MKYIVIWKVWFFFSSSTDVSAIPLVILNKINGGYFFVTGGVHSWNVKEIQNSKHASKIQNIQNRSPHFCLSELSLRTKKNPSRSISLLHCNQNIFFTGYKNYEIWRKKIIKSGSTNNFLLHIVIYTSIQNCWDTFFLYYFISTHVPPISLHNYLRQPVSNPLLWKQ